MRLFFAAVLSAVSATAAGAGCLEPGGALPTSIHFNDDSTEQGFSLTDEMFRTTVLLPGGDLQISKQKFGLYTIQTMNGAEIMTWDWGEQPLVPVQAMTVGQEMVFDPVTLNSGETFRATFVSRGPETLEVDGCSYTVVRVTRRYDFIDDQGAIVGDVWIEPEHLVVLRQEFDRLDSTGANIGHRSRLADRISP